MRENREILKDFEGYCPICKSSNWLLAYEEIKGRKYTVHIGCSNGCVHIQRAVLLKNANDAAGKQKAIALARAAFMEIVDAHKMAKWRR